MGGRELLYLAFTFAEIVFINSNYAIVAAFYQVHATTQLGISRADAATVFAAFSFANLLASPVSGALASRFGRKRVLLVGVATVSISTVVFGLVPDMLPGLPRLQVPVFIAARLLQGGGAALATTCIFADLTDRFPSNQGKVIGLAQGCDGLGWAAGPPIGGLLFVWGGFRLPFVCFGAAPIVGGSRPDLWVLSYNCHTLTHALTQPGALNTQ